jgi:acyl-CoA dehydrogenase
MTYRAPLKDIQFALDVVGPRVLEGCIAFKDYDAELAANILAEAGRFAEGVLDPLYARADREGAVWADGEVKTPAGFKEAYRQYVEGGWPQLRARPEYGGQGLPVLLASAVEEILASANQAFRLGPMLTHGATEAIAHCGSEAHKAHYLPRMVSGEWAGTMNLTESQAGSDLSQVATRAVPDGERYRLFGQKIFITYGEHDLTPNIVHLVLARIEGAPPGVKGISLFIVPKYLDDGRGGLGERNDVRCISIERKLGIHGSPTCTMVYGGQAGDGGQGGAVGYLLGQANHGLEYMFVMMNAARLSVGIEGYAVAERSYQQALEWAKTRVQGRPPAVAGDLHTIIGHPDVRRMLLTMKSQIEAMRYMALYVAAQIDIAGQHQDAATRAAAKSRADLLIPIVKGWNSETGFELASMGLQIHGGMGFIEETGAAQPLRDVRISAIYEGTTGIQAVDFIGRKLGRDAGAAAVSLIGDIRRELSAMPAEPATAAIVRAAGAAITRLESAVASMLAQAAVRPATALAIAVPLLKLAGVAIGGWLHARAASAAAAGLAAGPEDAEFLRGKLCSAEFYAAHVLPQTAALAEVVATGAASVLDGADLI